MIVARSLDPRQNGFHDSGDAKRAAIVSVGQCGEVQTYIDHCSSAPRRILYAIMHTVGQHICLLKINDVDFYQMAKSTLHIN